jgi:hypothetical protein
MANGNGVQPHEYAGTASLHRDDFDRLGHPGKFHRLITVNTGETVEFTGSNFGAGGIIVETGTVGSVILSGTGSLNLAHVTSSAPGILELSIRSATVTSGHLHVLIRNPIVR